MACPRARSRDRGRWCSRLSARRCADRRPDSRPSSVPARSAARSPRGSPNRARARSRARGGGSARGASSRSRNEPETRQARLSLIRPGFVKARPKARVLRHCCVHTKNKPPPIAPPAWPFKALIIRNPAEVGPLQSVFGGSHACRRRMCFSVRRYLPSPRRSGVGERGNQVKGRSRISPWGESPPPPVA